MVHLLDDLGTQRSGPLAERLGIRHLAPIRYPTISAEGCDNER
jgi:hypothetical protein